MALPEEIENKTEVAKPAKVGRRYLTADALPPSAWRKTLKYWAALWLAIALVGILADSLIVLWKMLS